MSETSSFIYDLAMKIPDQVISKKLQDEEVILELKSGTYYGLNDTGTFIFDLVKNGHSKAAIAQKLADEYEIGPEQAKEDVDSFLAEMKSESLLCGEL